MADRQVPALFTSRSDGSNGSNAVIAFPPVLSHRRSFFEEEDCKSARKKWKRKGDGGCHRENPRETRYKLLVPPLLPPTNDSKREKARTQEKMRTGALQISLAAQLTASGLRPHSAARKTAQSELYERNGMNCMYERNCKNYQNWWMIILYFISH